MQISTSANRHKSHKAPPLAQANWPEGIGRWAGPEYDAQKARRPSSGACCGPALRHTPGPPASPSYTDGPGTEAVALVGEERRGRGQEVEGLSGSEEGFGHGWSARPLPCSAIQSQAAATVDIGLESTPGLHVRPGRAGLQARRDSWGLRPTWTSALPTSQG